MRSIRIHTGLKKYTWFYDNKICFENDILRANINLLQSLDGGCYRIIFSNFNYGYHTNIFNAQIKINKIGYMLHIDLIRTENSYSDVLKLPKNTFIVKYQIPIINQDLVDILFD